MIDPLESFVFDLQRFDHVGSSSTEYSSIGESTAATHIDGSWYWDTDGSPIVSLSNGTGYSTLARFMLEGSTSTAGGDSTYYNVDSVTGVTLNASDSTYFFSTISGTEKFTIVGLAGNTIGGLSADASITNLVFSGATITATDYINIENDKVAGIYLGTTSASLSIAESTSGIGLNLNGYKLDIDQSILYQVTDSDKTISLTGGEGGYSAAINGVGGASRLFVNSSLSLLKGTDFDPEDEDTTYYIFNTSGSAYFDVTDNTNDEDGTGEVTFTGFHFVNEGDTLILKGKAVAGNDEDNTFTYYYNGSTFEEIFGGFTVNIENDTEPEFSAAGITNFDKLTQLALGGNSLFTLKNLKDGEGIEVSGVNVEFIEENGLSGGNIVLDATTGGISEINVDDGAQVQISNTSDSVLSDTYQIDGASVQIDVSKFVYSRVGGTSTINLNIFDESNEFGGGNKIAVKEFGNAEKIVMGMTSGTEIVIGDLSATLTTEFPGGSGSYDYETLGTFLLGTGGASRYIFGSYSGNDKIILNRTAQNFSFSYVDDSASLSAVVMPYLNVDGNGIYAVTKSGVSSSFDFSLNFGGGSATVSDYTGGGSATLMTDSNGYFNVAFDKNTGGISGISAVAGINGGASTFAAGMSFTVTGDVATDGQSGIYFGTSDNNIAIGTGSYVYSIGTNDTVVALTNAVDTVYALAGANKLQLATTTGGTITDWLDNDTTSNPDYWYESSSGSAYFTVGGSSLNGFVFGGQSDAIGGTSVGNLSLKYLNNGSESDVTKFGITLAAGATSYWLTMTEDNGEEFMVDEFGGSASIGLGGASFTFTGASNTANLTFNKSGSATGFSAATGSVAMNQAAASSLSLAGFSINNELVNISALNITNDNLLYNSNNKSLLGLGDKSTITAAGDITKIYAASGTAEFTFGNGKTFSAYAAGTSTGDLAYYSVSGGSATEFHFMTAGDSFSVNNGDTLPFFDNATSFSAPIVYKTNAAESAVDSYTVTKLGSDSAFEVSGFSNGNYAEFGTTQITFETLAANTGKVDFTIPTNALTAISGLDTAGDAVRVIGLSTSVDINGKGNVHIDGNNPGFLYQVLDKTNYSAILDDVYSNVTIRAAASATLIGTASGQSGIGDFTFSIAGGASSVYTVAGDSTVADGVLFQLQASTPYVTGISGVDNTESITSAFFASGGFSLNNQLVEVLNNGESSKAEYTFTGTSLAGLSNGDNVKEVGGISYFITKDSGYFTIHGAAMSIANDDNGVTFGVNGSQSLASIAGLSGTDAFAYGDFTGGITVNGISVSVTGDSSISVYAQDEQSIFKLGNLSGIVDVVQAEGVTMIGADGSGQFTFSFAGKGESFGLSGNDSEQTWFSFSASVVRGISGVDVNEIVTGGFSNGITINSNLGSDSQAIVQVTGDSDSSIAVQFMGESGYEIKDLDNGATVVSASGVYSAWTDTVGSTSATFQFGTGTDSQSFTVTQDTLNGVHFVLEKDSTKAVKVDDLDAGATLSGDLTSLSSINNASFSVLNDDSLAVVGKVGGISAILNFSDKATLNSAGSATLVVTDSLAGDSTAAFWFGSESFGVYTSGEDSSGVEFILNDSGSVIGVSSLAEGSTLRGGLSMLQTVNGKEFTIKGDDSFAVVGSDSGISKIIELGDKATVLNAAGASEAVTDENGTIYFGSISFAIDGDSSVTFGIDGASTATLISDLSGSITSYGFSSITSVNDTTFSISDDDGDLMIVGTTDAKGLSKIAHVGKENATVTINYPSSAIVETDKTGSFSFAASGQLFTTGDDATVTFGLSSNGAVSTIDGLSGWVSGSFSAVEAINGHSFAIVGDSGDMTVYGSSDENSVAGISGVGSSDGVTIQYVGGASYVQTDSVGSFYFGAGQSFTVEGDSSVKFITDTAEDALASVKGVDEFTAPATITGKLNDVDINNSTLAINVLGDDDNIFSYALDTSKNATLGGVGGSTATSTVTINGTAGASFVEVIKAGYYQFDTAAAVTLAGDNSDGILFGLSGLNVTSISGVSANESITAQGTLFAGGASVNGAAFQIDGDSGTLTFVGNDGESGITKIANVGGGSGNTVKISNAGGATLLSTDTDGFFTFGETSAITVESDTYDATIDFELDGLNITAISGISANESITGYGFETITSINGQSFAITGDENDLQVVGNATEDGLTTIAKVGGTNVTINNVGGASQVITDSTGSFNFAGNAAPFTVSGDSSVTFDMVSGQDASVAGVSYFADDIDATISGALSGLYINGTENQIVIGGDSDGLFSYAALSGNESATLGGVNASVATSTVTISNVAGASFVEVESDGYYKFAIGDGKTFQFNSTSDGKLMFGLDNGTVTSISGFEKNETIVGDFSDKIVINGGRSIQVSGDSSIMLDYDDIIIRNLSDGATIKFADGVTEAWTDSLGSDSTIAITDADGHHFTISGGDSNGVQFILDGQGHISGVSSLDADVTLRGNLDTLTTVNDTTFSIGGDSNFGVVGSDSGISKVIDLSDGATVVNAAGASEAVTDENGTIYFGSASFKIDGDNEVTFGIDGTSTATLISGLSGSITGYDFEDITSTNGQTFSIQNDADDLTIVGTEDEQGISEIANVGAADNGTVTVANVGGATLIGTDKPGEFIFGTASAITVEGDNAAVDFVVNSSVSVTAISGVNATETVTGFFDAIQTVNGQTFDISGDENDLQLVGNENSDGLTTIAKVGGDNVTINDVAGASTIITDKQGTFIFSGASFTTDDDALKFTVADDNVTAIDSLDGGKYITSSFSGVTSINGQSFGVSDSDNSLTVYGDTQKISKITGVTGDATISNAAGASQVETDKFGTFEFANQTFITGDDDTVTFGLDDETVTTIDKLSGNVTGNFDDVTAVNGHSFVIINDDNDLTVYGSSDENSVAGISGVGSADGVTIEYVGGASFVETDTDGTFTFGGGQSFTVEGDSSVKFVTDTADAPAKVLGVEEFSDGKITGKLNDVDINNSGLSIAIDGDSDSVFSYAIDTSGNATLGAVGGDNVTISGTAGASVVEVTQDGNYNFFNNQAFTLGGDSNGVNFALDNNTVKSVNDLDSDATLSGNLNELENVNGATFDVQGDDNFGVVGAQSGISKILDLGGTVTVAEAGGATLAVTNAQGQFTFDSTTYTVSGGNVEFELDDNAAVGVSGVDGNESVTGAFFTDGEFKLNGEEVNVTNGTNDKNYTFSGESLAGLQDGDNVTTAGGVKDFITASDGKFTLLGTAMEIQGDDEVKFGVNGSLSTIDSLASGASAVGNFDGSVTVNGKSIEVSGDSSVIVTGGNTDENHSVAKVGGLSGTVDIVQAEDVTAIGADGDGQFTFTFAGGEIFQLDGNDTLETQFNLSGDKVATISGLDTGETVTGDFRNEISVDGDAIHVDGDSSITVFNDGDKLVIGNLTGGASVIKADGVSSAFTDGDLTDSEFTFANGATFNVAGDSDGVEFLLDGQGNVLGLSGLDDGATLRGGLSNITVNGQLIDIRGDSSLAVVGAQSGISRVLDMSDNSTVNHAGGASELSTDTEGTFYFERGGVKFAVTGDSAVDFISGDGISTATGVKNLNGWIEADSKVFGDGFSVNGQSVQIDGDEGTLSIHGVDNQSIDTISGVGSSDGVTITSTGGASTIITDKQGEFTFPNQTFTTAGDDTVTFGLDNETVTTIDDLSGNVTGNFDDVTAVNGKSFDVQDDGDLTIYGTSDETAIGTIAGVTGDATINHAGGASVVQTDSEGSFDFAGNDVPFTVTGDDSVDFVMDSTADAKVIGVNNFGESAATIAGALSTVAIDGVQIDISGDTDNIFSYATDGNDNSTIGAVGGSSVEINGVGGAQVVEVTQDGEYNFKTGDGQKFTLATSDDSNGVNFKLNASGNVNAIESFDKWDTITGDFRDNPITVTGGDSTAVIQVDGDEFIMVEHDDILIRNLSDGATIKFADGVTEAWTDSLGEGDTLEIVDANGKSFTITGSDDKVHFFLDGEGHISGVNDLDESTTLQGALEVLQTINDESWILEVDVQGDEDYGVVGGKNADGVSRIIDLSDGATVVNAAGASEALTDTNGTFTFGDTTFTVASDSSVTFGLDGASTATLISGLSGSITGGNFEDIQSINGKTFDIKGDADDLTIVGTEDEQGISEIANVGAADNGTVTVANAGGASIITTDKTGTIKFDNQTFTTEDDATVKFGLDNETVTTIDELSGAVTGTFDGSVTVNGELVQITGDDSIKVIGDNDTAVSALGDVDANSTVNAWSSASQISVVGMGDFTFIGNDNVTQKFTTSGDSKFTFLAEDDSQVTGISDFADGTFTFDTATTTLDVNDRSLTFDTTEKVTLTIVDSGVSGVSGVTDSVDGLIDATVYGVEGVTTLTVNNKSIEVDDADDKFNVVVHDKVADYVYDVQGDATVNVANASVKVDKEYSNDSFVIGGEKYTLDDSDDKNDGFTFTTDGDKHMTGVYSLEGAVVGDFTGGLSINDGTITISSGSSVTVSTDGSGITGVDGLESGDSVSGDLGNATIQMPGSDGDTPSTLTVNDKKYELSGDSDGVSISGASGGVVDDLDYEARLKVPEGNYTVNGHDFTKQYGTLNDGTIIIGKNSDKSDAYIYEDANSTLVRKPTPIEHGKDNGFNLEDLTYSPHSWTAASTSAWTKDITDTILSSNYEFDRLLEITLNNNSSETQDFDLSSKPQFSKKIRLRDGDQNITLGTGNGNVIHVMSGATGNKVIQLADNNHGDVAIVDSSSGTVSIIGGTGDDSIFVRDSAPTTVDMSAGGADMLLAFAKANSRITVQGYDESTGAAIRVEEWASSVMADAIANGVVDFGDGIVKIDTDEGLTLIDIDPNHESTTDGWIVNLLSYKKNPEEKVAVGFTGEYGGQVGDESRETPILLVGNYRGNKNGSSTLTGGTGNDTVLAGAGDNINAGGGANLVSLKADSSRGGAIVNIGDGFTTITGMNSTLNEDTGDILEIYGIDVATTKFKLDGSNLIVKDDDLNFKAVIVDADTLGSSSAPYTLQYLFDTENEQLYRAAIGAENSTISVTDSDDPFPNVFLGDKTKVDFSKFSGDMLIDLEGDWSEESYIGGERVYLQGVNQLTAGEGSAIFKGSDANETLTAGKGNASLYGDGGNNLLEGYTSSDKEGNTMFIVLGVNDNARNTISGFEFITAGNVYSTADNIEIDTQHNHVSDVKVVNGTDVEFEVINNNNEHPETAVLKGAVNSNGVGKDFNISGVVAQVGTNKLNVDNYADFYVATGSNATVTVDKSVETNVNIWLDDPDSGKTFAGDIKVIDAKNINVNAELAGNALDNTIYGGKGDNSLWGGFGGNDKLVAGNGKDNFVYLLGNGNDTIEGANSGDTVWLGNITIDQIQAADVNGNVVLNMADGGKLTVTDGRNVEFKVSDGNGGFDTYQLNGNRQFEQK